MSQMPEDEIVRFTLPLPKPWAKALRKAAKDAEAQSTQEYLRWLVEGSEAILAAAAALDIKLPELRKSGKWGGERHAIPHPEMRMHLKSNPPIRRKPPRRKGIIWDATKPADWDDIEGV